ncbi:hypothetical protein XENORESO_008434 [Xenotaenia resolanae]|uniref:Uncharacterized protein n=1 Tax=Xenotaenia resolanae TaxID=208358 RepID=A0ABV0WF81_9TELE
MTGYSFSRLCCSLCDLHVAVSHSLILICYPLLVLNCHAHLFLCSSFLHTTDLLCHEDVKLTALCSQLDFPGYVTPYPKLELLFSGNLWVWKHLKTSKKNLWRKNKIK